MTDEKISVQTDAMLETIEIATADAERLIPLYFADLAKQ